MNEYYVFNKTVRGYLHMLKEKNCEDASASYFSDEKKYSIAVVADGHGSKSCFRSDRGSEMAVKTALNALKVFCDYYLVKGKDGEYTESEEFMTIFRNGKTKRQVIKQLTDSIISEWNKQVNKDLESDPVTDEEVNISGSKYRRSEPNHIYGTTLIAAAMLKNYMLLIQQGDGRCIVFRGNGSAEQPIPWDDRCHGIYTTSMSNDDVDTSIRSAVIDIRNKDVTACYIGSDGVEDSYRTIEGTNIFYMELSNMLTDEPENFLTYLDEYLPAFSKAGSGDDISVAGIVNTASIKKLYDKYKYDSELYYFEEKKIKINSKLNSMSRKHQHLKESSGKLKDSIVSASEELAETLIYPETLLKYKNTLDEKDSEVIRQYKADSDAFFKTIKKAFPEAYIIFKNALKKKLLYDDFNKATEALGDISSDGYQIKIKEISEKINKLCKEYTSCNKEFEEYNNKYTSLNESSGQCDSEIEKLVSEHRDKNQ